MSVPRFKSHPWHGLSAGERAPEIITVYIEIVPTDTVKYEIDKESGYLRVDRPQKYSNICPTLYGFLPRSYCAERVAGLCRERTGRTVVGDADPLDVCVLSERNFSHGDFIVDAIPIGGLRIIDGEEADDKILAVLAGDGVFGEWESIEELPAAQRRRIEHYFLTYKQPPGAARGQVELVGVYDRDEAREVIERSREDYRHHYPRSDGEAGSR